MKHNISGISITILCLLICLNGYAAYALNPAHPGKQPAEETKNTPHTDLHNLKRLKPFSVNGTIFTAHHAFPADTILTSAPTYKEGEVLVKFKKGVDRAYASRTAAVHGMLVMKEFKLLSERKGQAYALVKSDKLKAQEMVQKLENDPAVDAVSLNYERKISTIPNDPFFNHLWGLNNTGQDVPDYGTGTPDADIDSPEAWDIETGSPEVVVASIDSGVDYAHEDLAENMWTNAGEIAGDTIDNDGNGYVDDVYGIDAGDDDTDPMDTDGHGTHTAGTMAAAGNNALGVTGVNWSAKIMALKFFAADGSAYDDAAIACIEYVIHQKLFNNVNVAAINASWGGPGYSQTLKDAIEDAGNAGILFCAAAGNDGEDNDLIPTYPASFDLPHIITVAASDHTDQLTSWSNYGAASVDLAAPGASILSTYPGCSPDNPVFFDDMESGPANWTTGGTNNTWALSAVAYYSPIRAWSDSPGGNYTINTDSRLELSRDVDLSTYSGNATFYFYGAFFLEEDYDFLFVDISADSGASWVPYGYLTGNMGGWYFLSGDVPNEFMTAHFRLRFRLSTDYLINYDGVYIDDVGISTCQQSNNYTYLQGTSMATPLVTGACALVAAKFPDDSAGDRKNRILNAVDQKPSLTGKVLTGGRLNLYNALFIDVCPDDPNKTDPGACGCGIADTDSDADGIPDCIDNCSAIENADQQDIYPYPQGNNCGDACECEGNFDGDADQDGTDAFTFKNDFGRSILQNPCITITPCNGDFSCDGDCDGSDAFIFKQDFGRSTISNPCPDCVTAPWCAYP